MEDDRFNALFNSYSKAWLPASKLDAVSNLANFVADNSLKLNTNNIERGINAFCDSFGEVNENIETFEVLKKAIRSIAKSIKADAIIDKKLTALFQLVDTSKSKGSHHWSLLVQFLDAIDRIPDDKVSFLMESMFRMYESTNQHKKLIAIYGINILNRIKKMSTTGVNLVWYLICMKDPKNSESVISLGCKGAFGLINETSEHWDTNNVEDVLDLFADFIKSGSEIVCSAILDLNALFKANLNEDWESKFLSALAWRMTKCKGKLRIRLMSAFLEMLKAHTKLVLHLKWIGYGIVDLNDFGHLSSVEHPPEYCTYLIPELVRLGSHNDTFIRSLSVIMLVQLIRIFRLNIDAAQANKILANCISLVTRNESFAREAVKLVIDDDDNDDIWPKLYPIIASMILDWQVGSSSSNSLLLLSMYLQAIERSTADDDDTAKIKHLIAVIGLVGQLKMNKFPPTKIKEVSNLLVTKFIERNTPGMVAYGMIIRNMVQMDNLPDELYPSIIDTCTAQGDEIGGIPWLLIAIINRKKVPENKRSEILDLLVAQKSNSMFFMCLQEEICVSGQHPSVTWGKIETLYNDAVAELAVALDSKTSESNLFMVTGQLTDEAVEAITSFAGANPLSVAYLKKIGDDGAEAEASYAYIRENPDLLSFYISFVRAVTGVLLAASTIQSKMVDASNNSKKEKVMDVIDQVVSASGIPGVSLMTGVAKMLTEFASDRERMIRVERITLTFPTLSSHVFVEMVGRRLTIAQYTEIVSVKTEKTDTVLDKAKSLMKWIKSGASLTPIEALAVSQAASLIHGIIECDPPIPVDSADHLERLIVWAAGEEVAERQVPVFAKKKVSSSSTATPVMEHKMSEFTTTTATPASCENESSKVTTLSDSQSTPPPSSLHLEESTILGVAPMVSSVPAADVSSNLNDELDATKAKLAMLEEAELRRQQEHDAALKRLAAMEKEMQKFSKINAIFGDGEQVLALDTESIHNKLDTHLKNTAVANAAINELVMEVQLLKEEVTEVKAAKTGVIQKRVGRRSSGL